MITAKGRNQPHSSLSQQLWRFYLPIYRTQSLAYCRLGFSLGQGKESDPHPTATNLQRVPRIQPSRSQIPTRATRSNSERRRRSGDSFALFVALAQDLWLSHKSSHFAAKPEDALQGSTGPDPPLVSTREPPSLTPAGR